MTGDLTPYEERVFRSYAEHGDWATVARELGRTNSAIRRTMTRVYRRHAVNGAVQLFRKLGWLAMVAMAVPVTAVYAVLVWREEHR